MNFNHTTKERTNNIIAASIAKEKASEEALKTQSAKEKSTLSIIKLASKEIEQKKIRVRKDLTHWMDSKLLKESIKEVWEL